MHGWQVIDLVVMICIGSVHSGCKGDSSLIWFILWMHFLSVVGIVALVATQRWNALNMEKSIDIAHV